MYFQVNPNGEEETNLAKDAQKGCGHSCALQSLISETSHLIDQHGTVQLRPPPYI